MTDDVSDVMLPKSKSVRDFSIRLWDNLGYVGLRRHAAGCLPLGQGMRSAKHVLGGLEYLPMRRVYGPMVTSYRINILSLQHSRTFATESGWGCASALFSHLTGQRY